MDTYQEHSDSRCFFCLQNLKRYDRKCASQGCIFIDLFDLNYHVIMFDGTFVNLLNTFPTKWQRTFHQINGVSFQFQNGTTSLKDHIIHQITSFCGRETIEMGPNLIVSNKHTAKKRHLMMILSNCYDNA